MGKRGRPRHPDLLTPREWEVLALLRDGLSNEEIAERLGISLSGAKYHVSEILGKLGVSSREEAARWQPGARPWWAAAVAPLGFWRKISPGWVSTTVGAGLLAIVAAGIGLLVWGLVRTGGDASPSLVADLSTATSPPTARPTAPQPPLPTPQPFVAYPVDCPGGYATPEEAIRACLAIRYENYQTKPIYVGDCDTPRTAPPGEGFDRPCSSWEDGTGTMRSYLILDVAVDAADRLILEQRADGWVTVGQGGCAVQHQADTDLLLEVRGGDMSEVRVDDCRFAPLPMARPTVRIGPFGGKKTENGRTEISLYRSAFYPGRGVKLALTVTNISGTTLPWTSDVGTDIQLVGDDGTEFTVSEVGGTLARSIPEGFPPDANWDGWLVFPIRELATYTLYYPGQPELRFILTREHYRTSREEFFEKHSKG